MKLEERIIEIDNDVSALAKSIEYIEAMIMQLLQEKNDCIHDLGVEKNRTKIGFKSNKKDEKTTPGNTTPHSGE